MNPVLPPYRVRTAGCIDRDPYHSTPGTKAGDWMLTVHLEGSGLYRGPEGTQTIRSPMVGLVPPEDAGVLMALSHDPYLHYWCRFSGDWAIAVATSIIAKEGTRFFTMSHAAAIADPLRRMGRVQRMQLPASMGLPEIWLAEALAILQHGPSRDEPSPRLSGPTLEEHLRHIIAEPTDLHAIATHFGVSRTTLCRRSASGHGCGVQQLHERLKMDWARTLLRRGLTVDDTAARVGYADRRYFARVFRKHHGLGPRDWLRESQ